MHTLELFRALNRQAAGFKYIKRCCAAAPGFQISPASNYGIFRQGRAERQMSTSGDTHSDKYGTTVPAPPLEVEAPSKADAGDALGSEGSEEDLYALIEEHNGTTKGFLQRLLPVEYMRDTLVALHDATGLSWAATITALTLFLKLCFVPVWAMGERARRNNAHLMPIAAELQEKLRVAQKTGNVKLAMEIQRALYRQMMRKTFLKGAALQVLAAGTQGITFAWVYGGLKMFAIEPRYCPGFVLENPIWLESLALPDPYYVFSATLWLLMTLVYELNRRTAERMRRSSGVVSETVQEQEARQAKMKYFTRGAIAMFAYFSSSMTSGTFFYLIPSFLFQTVLRYVSQGGVVAKVLRLPTPSLPPPAKAEPPKLQRVKGF
ncbi:mitochondrial inner membrane protein OXA1, putative [Babesia caballi]|uniref:Mitochondrial inner membrane protein OXA1, putative n=1 Tax=Babesia caballi TaxID=5871 RepID=A0AAV4LZ66_BABCB|nr:mitochondrial inner membrane protein OXA1, putative [Babesia caballi]